ncbi:MAG: hypothetical protein LW875_05990 [Proteobacteria bacterium]|nr:hypothetical protein [Pseudomonadota bacterium]
MSSPKMALVLIASLALGLSACSKDDKSTPKESILKQSTKPGYLPDGTKVAELSDEEMKQVLSSVEGAGQVATALTAAMEARGGDNGNGGLPGLPGGPRRMSLNISGENLTKAIEGQLQAITNIRAGEGYSEELKKELLAKCTFNIGEAKTEVSDASRSGNNISGNIRVTQRSEVTGRDCLVTDSSSMEAKAGFSGTLNSQDEMVAMSANGTAQVSKRTQAKPSVAQKTGFVGMNLTAKVDGGIQASSGLARISGELDGRANIDTLGMGVVSGAVLADMNLAGGESSSTGTLRAALILTAQGKTVLIQIFANIQGENNSQVEVFVNGKKVDPETLK